MSILNKKVGLHENVEYQLKDKNGNIKPLFKANKIYQAFIKAGIVSPNLRSPLLGRYTDKLSISNLVVTTGLAGVAARINGSGTPDAYTYIALGSGTTAAVAGDTALETEITTDGGERASATPSLETTDTTDDTAVLVKTFTFSGDLTISESGVLNASSSGTLLARQVFTGISVASGDSLQITWKFDVDTV